MIKIKHPSRVITKFVCCLAALALIAVTTPMQGATATSPIAKVSKDTASKVKPFKLNHVSARPAPSLKLILPNVFFTSNPKDIEITNSHILPESLVPFSNKSVPGENLALAKALVAYSAKHDPENISDLTAFLKAFPQSRWNAAIRYNLGVLRFQTGYLTDAMTFWQSCWTAGKGEKGSAQQAIASRAAAELAMLNARLGRQEKSQALVSELKNRGNLGNSGALVESTKEGLTMMKVNPMDSFKCGPYAVNTLLYQKNGSAPCVNPIIKAYPTDARGTNLLQVKELSEKVGLKLQMVKRTSRAPLVVPSIMHWKENHFSAITAKTNTKFRIQDPTFGHSASAWLSANALDAESDGYFLVPEGPMPDGWVSVSDEDAKSVWGKGVPLARNNCKTCEEDQESMGSCSSGGCGMPVASAMSMNASVHIVDTPLQSSPPIGPDISMTLTYNVSEGNQPPNFFFSNVGVNWSLNFFSYLQSDASQNLTVSVPGGGFESYVNNGGTSPYSPDILSQATMVSLTGGGYQRVLRDGATQNYTKALSQSGVSYYLMTSVADAQGNAATISYDSYNRVSNITDACGNVYGFSYLSNTPDAAGRYLLLSSITDAFSRSMSLTYDASNNYLASITDAAGNVSSILTTPYAVPHVYQMTTPYGTTHFDGAGVGAASEGTQFTFPDGSKSVIMNSIWSYKDTYYWDREAMAKYPNDINSNIYSHCKRTHWAWEPVTNTESAVPVWVQKPLETANFYTYPNQTDLGEVGSINEPASVSRMLVGNRVLSCDVIGASPVTPGDFIYVYICDRGLPANAQETITYELVAGDTPVSIANSLVSLINGNVNLANRGISATAVSSRMFFRSNSSNSTSYFSLVRSTSSTYTTLLHLNMDKNIDENATVGGTATAGDTVTATVADWRLTGGQKSINYTVQSGDDLAAIAAGLSAAINSDSDLQAINIGSIVSGSTVTLQSISYSFNSYQTSVNSGATETLVLSSNAQTWQYQYNNLGYVTQTIDPVGRTFSYTYAANNIDLLEKRETKGSDNFLMGHWEYGDPSSPHRVTLFVDGSGQHTQFAYNALKEPESTTDANGDVTTASYSSAGYLTQVDGPLSGTGDVTNFDFFGYGSVHTITDSEGYQLVFSYDDLNRKTKTLFPDGTSETTIYDRLDAVINSDRLNRATISTFDSMDQLVENSDPLGRKTKYSWCVCGGLAGLTDPLGQTTSWVRDLEGRIRFKKYADGTRTKFDYDPITGRLATKTDGANQVTSYSYNVDNTLAQKTYSNGDFLQTGPTLYTYDPAFPRLINADNSTDWGQVAFTYNNYVTNVTDPAITGGGKLASETNNNNWFPISTVNYSYDNLGRISNRSIGGTSYSSTISYDAMSRVTAESNELGNFGYEYVDNSPTASKGTTRLASISYPNSQKTRFNYYENDGDQRLKQISNLNSNFDTLSQFSYFYNAAGEITKQARIQNDVSEFDDIKYDAAGQLIAYEGNDGSSGQTRLHQNNYFYDDASNISGIQRQNSARIKISGTVSSGDVLNLTVADLALSSGSTIVSYVVQTGDTLSSIANNLAAAVCQNTDLQNLGVNAVASTSDVIVQSTSQNLTSFGVSTNTGATESVRLGVSKNFIELATVSGTVTAGDILTLTVHDPNLTSGKESVVYTVQSADTLFTIASGLKSAVNADASLQTIGVVATAYQANTSIQSSSQRSSTYSQTRSNGATEQQSLTVNPNQQFNIGVTGSITNSDTVSLSVYDKSLPTGVVTKSYIVQSGDSLTSIAAGLSTALNSDATLQTIGLTATATGFKVAIQSNSVNPTSFRQSVSSGATEILVAPLPINGTQTLALAGTATATDTITLNVYDAGLPGGSEVLSYTVQAGDSLSSIASSIASLIDGDVNLQSAGVTASATAGVIFVNSLSIQNTSYTASTSSGATEIVFLAPSVGTSQFYCNNVNELTNIAPSGPVRIKLSANKAIQKAFVGDPNFSLNSASITPSTYSASASGGEIITFGVPTNGLTIATASGTVATGDTVALTVTNPDLSGGLGSVTETYTVASGDTLYEIVDGLVSLVNQDVALQNVGQTAKTNSNVSFNWSQKFEGLALTQPGVNPIKLTTLDAAGGTDISTIQTSVNNAGSPAWIWDQVGNFSYGPTQGYAFDAENRFAQLDIYSPSQSTTYYSHDALGRRVSIAVWQNGVQVSQKIYVWSGNKIVQEQDGITGSVTKNYYDCGEMRQSASFFYSKDMLGSISEMSDLSGGIQAQYSYSKYGQPTKVQGAIDCDFQFAGLYFDTSSSFNLTYARAYSSSLGRWVSRDPSGGFNLFAYCDNDPLGYFDPNGYGPTGAVVGAIAGAGVGGVVGAGAGTLALPGGGTIAGGELGVWGGALTGASWGSAIEDVWNKFGAQPIIFTHCEVRGKNKMRPVPGAQGPHSTWKGNGAGQITGTQEWIPNSKNPSGFDSGIRGDFNPTGADHNGVPTPHMQSPDSNTAVPPTAEQTPSNAATNNKIP